MVSAGAAGVADECSWALSSPHGDATASASAGTGERRGIAATELPLGAVQPLRAPLVLCGATLDEACLSGRLLRVDAEALGVSIRRTRGRHEKDRNHAHIICST